MMNPSVKIKLVKRKHPRLKDYDYSSNGYYFITVCSYRFKRIFSRIYPPYAYRYNLHF